MNDWRKAACTAGTVSGVVCRTTEYPADTGPEEKVSPVQASVQQLDKALAELTVGVHELQDRLEPVLSPEPVLLPEAVERSEGPPRSGRLADRLDNLLDCVRLIQERVASIASRLEV